MLAEALEDQRHFQAWSTRWRQPSPVSAARLTGQRLRPLPGTPSLKAIQVFEERDRQSESVETTYLIARRWPRRITPPLGSLARPAQKSDDLRLASLESTALRPRGKVDQGVAAMETSSGVSRTILTRALAQVYSTRTAAPGGQSAAGRAGQVPGRTGITFELGAVLDKQKSSPNRGGVRG